MKDKQEILDSLRAMKPELASRYNVRSIGIFGSVVRGESRAGSDLDILVEFGAPIGLFKFLELEELLSERLGVKVDLVSKKALKPHIGQVILSEALLA